MEKRIFGLESEYGVTCTFRGQRRLSPDEGGGYTATIPLLGAKTFVGDGETPEEALQNLEDIKRQLIPVLIADGVESGIVENRSSL